MERYEYLNGPPAPRMVAELAMRHDVLVKQLADAQATIAALEETILKMGENAAVVAKDAMAAKAQVAALQGQVRELEEWVQDQSTANLETMRHTDEMQSRALEAEQQLTQHTSELERVRDQYAGLRKMVLALPKVEGEIVYQSGLGWIIRQDSKWEPIPEFGRGLRASLLQHRQGMEG